MNYFENFNAEMEGALGIFTGFDDAGFDEIDDDEEYFEPDTQHDLRMCDKHPHNRRLTATDGTYLNCCNRGHMCKTEIIHSQHRTINHLREENSRMKNSLGVAQRRLRRRQRQSPQQSPQQWGPHSWPHQRQGPPQQRQYPREGGFGWPPLSQPDPNRCSGQHPGWGTAIQGNGSY